MRALLPLLVLLAASAASAQTVALRFADAERQDAYTAAEVAEHLVVVTLGTDRADAAAAPVVLHRAVVAGGRVVAAESAPFVGMPVSRIGRGTALRGDVPDAYRQARAEARLRPDLFFPGDDFFPGDSFFPGDDFYPGDLFFPGDDFEPASARLAGVVVTEASARGADERALARAAREMDRRAFEAGEPFLIFFATPAEGAAVPTEMLGFLRGHAGARDEG